jgi:hypothetical protein
MKEAAIVYLKRIVLYFYAVASYVLASALMAGALVGAWMLVFMALLLLDVAATIGPFVLLPLGAVIVVLVFYFLSAFRGGFVATCYDVYEGRPVSPIVFTDYSLRRAPTFFAIQLVSIVMICIVAVPLVAINAFLQNTALAAVSGAVIAFVSFLVGAVFLLAVPAAVVDNVGAAGALSRGLKTAASNGLDFVLFVGIVALLYTMVFVIPLVGWLLCLALVLPVTDTASVIFYRSLRKS